MSAREPDSTAEWLAANPPPDGAFTQSAAGVARRTLAGEPFDLAMRELLDELALLQTDDQRRRAIEEEPPPIGDRRHDAYLAALAEHFAARSNVARPTWTTAPSDPRRRCGVRAEARSMKPPPRSRTTSACRRAG